MRQNYTMRRRRFLAATAATLAAPALARAQAGNVLKFIPQSDVAVLDPIWTTAYVTRNHGYMIFDTLFGTDSTFKPSPQMAAGMTTDNDGKLVRDPALGQTRRVWHDVDGGDRRTVRARRQDDPVPTEEAFPAVAGRAG
jgi:hypothetical protein